MKIDGKIVGSELRSLRMKKRLSAEDVCDNVGIHVNSLYKYEKDASLLKFETLEKAYKNVINFKKLNGKKEKYC
jgi:transcriptional regulator with XRE-family HTH domain